MTSQPRTLCPTSATWHGRNMVTDRRWRITTPDNRETVVCSAACALTWLCSVLPADLEGMAINRQQTGNGAAA